VCVRVCVGTHQPKKLLISWQFSGPNGVIEYGSGWKDVVKQCLEFAPNVAWFAGGLLRLNGVEHFLPRVSTTGYLLPLPLHRLPLQHLEERLEVQKSLSCRLRVQRMAVQTSFSYRLIVQRMKVQKSLTPSLPWCHLKAAKKCEIG